MAQILVDFSVWLHSLAAVIFIGFYVVLALLFVPAFAKELESGRGTIITAISRRSRTWLYASALVFAATGLHLMLVNKNYLGIGRFDNAWSILMLVKHCVIFVMIVIGFWFNAIQRVGPLASSNSGAAQAFAGFRVYVNWMAICGVVVLLLTAMTQAY